MARLYAAAVLAAAFAAGCGDHPGAPASPSEAAPTIESPAAPDGTTLKVSPPSLSSPGDGAKVDSRRPTLRVGTATPSFPEAGQPPLKYRFHLLAANGSVVRNVLTSATSWRVPADLAYETTYRWRARAEIDNAFGPWSGVRSFRTPDRPKGTILPPGPYPRTGAGVAAFVMRHWPDKLRCCTGMTTRTHNMEFLRDRMIEVARCGGLDVARNLKRGVGPHSHDAIAWRTGGRVEVVDIALAFKDPSRPLHLHWNITAGPPGYDRYRNAFHCQ